MFLFFPNYTLGYETDAKVVALRYIKSFTFIIDILSLLPLEILAAGMNDSSLNWAITFKLNRLLKLWKVSHKKRRPHVLFPIADNRVL